MLKKLLEQHIAKKVKHKTVAVLLSGWVDSLSLALSAHNLGKMVICYSFHLKDNLSYDFETAKNSNNFTSEEIEAAYEYILLAEGSDWFWWYGDDQNSSVDEYFDEAFRTLLSNVYIVLNIDIPTFLSEPINKY